MIFFYQIYIYYFMNNKLSPQKYIQSKGRNLPFYECYISEEWKENGLATIIISKKMPGGNFIIAYYLVDIYCLGLKNTFYRFNVTEHERAGFMSEMQEGPNEMIPCDTELIHNLIFGAIDYAAELGFEPHKDFRITENLLNPDLITDGIDEIEFGFNGQPYYVQGPDDQVEKILASLNRNPGEGNYGFMQHEDDFY